MPMHMKAMPPRRDHLAHRRVPVGEGRHRGDVDVTAIAPCTASPNAMAESISSMPHKRSGPAMPVATEETANGPNLLLLMRPSGSDNQPALVPGAKFMKDGGQLPKDPSLIAIVGRGMP
ncbi:hypothetical protein BSZ14_04090 [Sphingomonas sp. Sph1(2015)]|nr:hypothetical protein BSZ14_04090 [Sphingomonas sp. Sph1(2015)]